MSRSLPLYILATAVAITLSADASAQLFYSHTSGSPDGDGFIWDESPQGGLNNLSDGNQFDTPDGVSYNNFTGNDTFFDDNYQAAGNAPNINGDAWWGNPIDNDAFPQANIHFFNSPFGGAQSLDFDFAWAIAGEDAPDFLELEIYDYEGGIEGEDLFTYVYVELDQVWNAGGTFGGFDGRSGTVFLDIFDLTDENTGEPFTEIEDVLITVADVANEGGTGEFAIDNVSIDGGVGGGSEVIFTGNGGSIIFENGTTLTSNYLRKAGTATFSTIEVTNVGTENTTFSTTFDSINGLTPGTPDSGKFVAASSNAFTNSPIGSVDQNSPSGHYSLDVNLFNDTNPSDPINFLTARIGLHDAPSLGGAQNVDVSAGEQVTLSNAAAPAGGLRAGVEITSTLFSGGFAVLDGVTAGAQVLPDESISSTNITFDRYGKLNGTYNGTITVNMEMKSQLGFFLSDAETLDRVYNLSFDLDTTNIDTVNFAASEEFGPRKIGVNNATMAATILDGTSSAAQTVVMTPGGNPEFGELDPSADLAGDPVDVSFSAPGDLYVLQYTYDEGNLPGGLNETDILPLAYETGQQDWINALGLNSDGGAGETFFLGSFADFLLGTDGTLDPADLSAYGVDVANNMAWVVLDYDSLFGFGRFAGAPTPGDFNNDGEVNGLDFMAWQRNPAIGDLADWQANYGQPLAGAESVPEPSSAVLLVLGAFIFYRGSMPRR